MRLCYRVWVLNISSYVEERVLSIRNLSLCRKLRSEHVQNGNRTDREQKWPKGNGMDMEQIKNQ